MSDVQLKGRDALEGVLLTHGSEWWDDNDRGLYADELIDCFGQDLAEMDAFSFAHIVWTMGYTSEHAGRCRYRDEEDAHDGDHSNACDTCSWELQEMGRKVVAALEKEGDAA